MRQAQRKNREGGPQAPRSTVRVMCNRAKPPDPENGGPPQLLGKAQPGELLTALMAGFSEEDGSLVYVTYERRSEDEPEEANSSRPHILMMT